MAIMYRSGYVYSIKADDINIKTEKQRQHKTEVIVNSELLLCIPVPANTCVCVLSTNPTFEKTEAQSG